MKLYITAAEIAEILGISKGYAYEIMRGLNAELKAQGYITVAGKLPRAYFAQKCFGYVEVTNAGAGVKEGELNG